MGVHDSGPIAHLSTKEGLFSRAPFATRARYETSRIVRWCKSQDGTIDVALLDPVSPIEWNSVILYGQAPIGPGPSPLIKELKGYLAAIWAVPRVGRFLPPMMDPARSKIYGVRH